MALQPAACAGVRTRTMKRILSRRATRPKRVRRKQQAVRQRPRSTAPVESPRDDEPSTFEPSRPVHALTETELRNVPAPEWDLQDRIQRGGITMIVGPRGSHKSRVLAAVSGALAEADSKW